MGNRVVVGLTALLVVVTLAAAVAIYFVIKIQGGFRPESAALIAATVTLIGALVTQVINANIARSNQQHTQQLEDRRAQAEALRIYLERMGELVSREKLRTLPDQYNDKRILARVQTKTVLRVLSPARKRDVLLFLREMRLINRYEFTLDDGTKIHPHIVGLSGADLTDADLSHARLISTSKREPVSLEGANLENANLTDANL